MERVGEEGEARGVRVEWGGMVSEKGNILRTFLVTADHCNVFPTKSNAARCFTSIRTKKLDKAVMRKLLLCFSLSLACLSFCSIIHREK